MLSNDPPNVERAISKLKSLRDDGDLGVIEDDGGRPTAEAALKKVGRAARPALIAFRKIAVPSNEHESELSLRRRRSALKLLDEIGILRRTWPELRCLMGDTNAKISMLA